MKRDTQGECCELATIDDYARTCMCGAPGRASAARDRPIDMCSRLSALVCPRAVDGNVCVCVFPSLDCIVEKKVASQRPIVPSSSALAGWSESLCVFVFCLRPPRCVSTGPEVVCLAGMANERERERERGGANPISSQAKFSRPEPLTFSPRADRQRRRISS